MAWGAKAWTCSDSSPAATGSTRSGFVWNVVVMDDGRAGDSADLGPSDGCARSRRIEIGAVPVIPLVPEAVDTTGRDGAWVPLVSASRAARARAMAERSPVDWARVRHSSRRAAPDRSPAGGRPYSATLARAREISQGSPATWADSSASA